MRVRVAVCSIPDAAPEVLVFSNGMTESDIVKSIADSFQCLSEKFPQTLIDLNACVAGFSVTLETSEVLTR